MLDGWKIEVSDGSEGTVFEVVTSKGVVIDSVRFVIRINSCSWQEICRRIALAVRVNLEKGLYPIA